MPPGEIPVQVIQRAYEDSGLSYGEIARRLGWVVQGQPDDSRVARRLGLRKYRQRGRVYRSRYATYDTAAKLIRAMGFDPVDYGL